MMAGKKVINKKKAVVPTPGSISKDGNRAKAAAPKKRMSQQTGVEDFSSISVHEKVALLAYSYWEERGKQGGSPEEDWYRAEKEVLANVIHKNS